MARERAGGRTVAVEAVPGPVKLMPTPEMLARGQRIVELNDDDACVPAGARSLAQAARVAGWDVKLTYGKVAVPPGGRLPGATKIWIGGHVLVSVAVRLGRGNCRGYAMWHNAHFHEARLIWSSGTGGRREYGLRALMEEIKSGQV